MKSNLLTMALAAAIGSRAFGYQMPKFRASKYQPHQGKAECARRLRNIERGMENAAPFVQPVAA